MKGILLFFLLGSTLVPAVAQNLVKNPSLETIRNGIVGYTKVSGTPDVASKYDKVIQYPPYYNAYQADLPTRSVSTIRFGDICLCQWFSETSSELTQTELLKPLKKNREYVVSLFTIKASVREPAISEIPVYFTKKRLQSSRKVYGFKEHELTGQSIPYLSLKSPKVPVLNSQEEWVKVSAVYKSKGGERYITIGNFIGANKAALETMNPEGWEDIKNYFVQGTYYCYDNLSVVPKSEVEVADEEEPGEAAPDNSLFAIGKTITLSDVNFATGSHEILPVAFPLLDSLTAFMQTAPEVVVHIQGHTDNVGSDEDNLQLSLRRAQAVNTYLTRSGIAPERITFEGYGESRPKVVNDTERNRALNRRVEILLKRRT